MADDTPPPVPNFYVLFGVIALAAAILWASRQGKPRASINAAKPLPKHDKPPHPMAWIACSLFGTVFLASGVAMCFSPGEPATGGGKGGAIFLYLAYWLLGDYGAAIAFMGLGALCLHKAYALLRDA